MAEPDVCQLAGFNRVQRRLPCRTAQNRKEDEEGGGWRKKGNQLGLIANIALGD